MSIFDFPRINVKGLMTVNVGTGNNDDYALQPGSPSGYSGNTAPGVGNGGYSLRLGNTVAVQPDRHLLPDTGNDPALVQWITQPQNVQSYNNSTTPTPAQVIPGEWNYFGDMGLDLKAMVIGITTSPNVTITDPASDDWGLLGGMLSFNNRPDSTGRSTAMLIDVDPETPPASQVFSDNLLLQDRSGRQIFTGKPSKASTRLLNFQRNTFLYGPNGASGTFQCVVPVAEGQQMLSIFKGLCPGLENISQLVFRYTLFRSLQTINTFKYANNQPPEPTWLSAITELYQNKGTNPSYVQVSGTIAPYFDGELQSMPTGRFLAPSATNFFTSPGGNLNPTGGFSLAPAIVKTTPGNTPEAPTLISIDLSASLPDHYKPDPNFDPQLTGNNNKYDLGSLALGWRTPTSAFLPVGNIPYTLCANIGGIPTQVGDTQGWIFDFLVPANQANPPAGSGLVVNGLNQQKYPSDLLIEQPIWFVSDQPAIYAEQGLQPTTAGWATMPPLPMTTATVSSQGYMDTPISFCAFAGGSPDPSGIYEIWMSNESYVDPRFGQSPEPVRILRSYSPGQNITIPTDTPGAFLLTIAPQGSTAAQVASILANPLTAPLISLRVLPNIEYIDLFTFDTNGKPVAGPALNWQALYKEVFRNYYLLYPAMSKILPLNDPNQWIGPTLNTLLERVDTQAWNTLFNMPRTRDLSATRRWLVQAYCNKFVTASPPANLG